MSAEEAAAAALRLEEQESLSFDWILCLANHWQNVDNWRNVKRLLQRAQDINPDALSVHLLQADLHRRAGRLHREKTSLEAALELLPRSDDRQRTLRMRVAAVLMSQEAYGDAWEILSSYDPALLTDNELLNLAYCATRIGAPEIAIDTYRKLVPGPDDGFNAIDAAELQLKQFHRTDEALRLLDLDQAVDPTSRWYEVRYRALILSGQTEAALDALREACARPGHSRRSAHTLGQLLELCGHAEEALDAYQTANKERPSPLLRFRAGSLLVALDTDYKAAVEYYLSGFKTPRSMPRRIFTDEVDPQVPLLRRRLTQPGDDSEYLQNLEQLFTRLSHQRATMSVGLNLAQAYLNYGRVRDAWRVIEVIQEERLPAVSLRRIGRVPAPTLVTQFAEMQETLPVEDNRVYWESNIGGSTSCNPLALCLALLDDPRYAHLTHVWSVLPGTVLHPRLLNRSNVVFVARGSVGHARALATAKYLVDNTSLPWYFSKRDGQRVLSTWHGVPWKTLGKDKSTGQYTATAMTRTALVADLMIAPDQHTMDVLTKSTGAYGLMAGTLMRTDYPRNDLAVNLSKADNAGIKRTLGLRLKERVVLFMPTWRGSFHDRSAEVETTIQRARELSGRGYKVVLRAHHYVREAFTAESQPSDIVFAPETIDTYELLGVADALVTDFSSVFFDAAALRVPVVKLVGDIEEYRAERGLYFDPEEVPGANAATTSDARVLLAEALADPLKFTSAYDAQTLRFVPFSSGRASQDVINVFFGGDHPEHTFTPSSTSKRHRLLLQAGGLASNGITSSLRNLVSSISPYVDAYVFAHPRAFHDADPAMVDELDTLGVVLPRTAGLAGTRMETEVLRFLGRSRFAPSKLVSHHLDSALKRMATRLLGDSKFDSAVDFVAYTPVLSALFSLGFKQRSPRRGLILHNEFAQEIRLKYPSLASTLTLLDEFDFVASVSDGLRHQNARAIADRRPSSPLEQITLPNTLDLERIRAGSSSPLEQPDLDWYARPGRHAVVLGRFSLEKNHEMLLTALHTYLQHPDAKPISISFLGDGPDRPIIETQATKLGLESHVRFLGQVSNPFNHLRAADALYLPSRYEGQPMVLLEALTLGTAAVATDIPGSRSVLRDGELGSLVPLSPEGVLEGVRLIAEGEATQSGAFDADAYNLEAVQIFLTAIGVDVTEALTPHQMPPDPQPASS